ncbi:hypothetical protein D7V86_11750 [bacterium D16-51]|nr:hypothetical protein D7V96_13605 [bacterium D16-59]RKI59687.1 hypothetical protein D7V86_11750 [bacterium D16-51]
MQRAKRNACKELKVPWHLATARGTNTPPLWGEQAKEKLGHAPLLCGGYLAFLQFLRILYYRKDALGWNIR